jgi:hypothetical protein
MKRYLLALSLISAALLSTGCARKALSAPSPQAAAYGSALVESSGGKQIAAIGSILPQPVVVQVNDEQGNAVTGAAVAFSGPAGVTFDPPLELPIPAANSQRIYLSAEWLGGIKSQQPRSTKRRKKSTSSWKKSRLAISRCLADN